METFVNELIWREFYIQVLWFNPGVLDAELQEDCRDLAWRDHWRPEEPPAGEAFQRWCCGETCFPIVDAGMREMNATGFMHNRVRMITAMFLTKDLHIWWMHGESYFIQRLVDGEIASNNGGWQWSASTGTDAARVAPRPEGRSRLSTTTIPTVAGQARPLSRLNRRGVLRPTACRVS